MDKMQMEQHGVLTVPKHRWPQIVKDLDENKCAFCGGTERLEAHHIETRAKTPEKATSLENGITLCHKCHYTAHAADYAAAYERPAIYQQVSTDPEIMDEFIRGYAACKVVVGVPKGQKEVLQAHAASTGESVNAFINRAIANQMAEDLEK